MCVFTSSLQEVASPIDEVPVLIIFHGFLFSSSSPSTLAGVLIDSPAAAAAPAAPACRVGCGRWCGVARHKRQHHVPNIGHTIDAIWLLGSVGWLVGLLVGWSEEGCVRRVDGLVGWLVGGSSQ